MALQVHALLGLVLWTIDTAVCFKSSCLNAMVFSDDKIEIIECNNKSVNFSWSLGSPLNENEFVYFEYSCINASSIAVLENIKLLKHEAQSGNSTLRPSPSSTCFVSACYMDSLSSLHYIAPTGCAALPSTSHEDENGASTYIEYEGTSIKTLTSGFTAATPVHLSSRSPLHTFSTSLPIQAKERLNVNLTLGVAIGVTAFVLTAIFVLALVSVTCAVRGARIKSHQKELKQLGTDIIQEIDHSYLPVDITKPAHRVMHASSEISIIDGLEWFPSCGMDHSKNKTFFEAKQCPNLKLSGNLNDDIDPCITSYLEQHPTSFCGEKITNESMLTMNLGFSLNSNGYCMFKP